jgi:hypothetical protein
MLRLAIVVLLGLQLLAPIALYSSTEVVILTLAADPTSIWKTEGLV